MPDNKQTTWGEVGCGVVLLLVILLGFKMCSGGGSGEKSPPLLAGDTAEVWVRDGVSVHVAPTKKDYDRVAELLMARDDDGLLQMIVAGRAMLVESGTECRVIDPGLLTYEVRLLDGKHSGQSVYLAREFLRR